MAKTKRYRRSSPSTRRKTIRRAAKAAATRRRRSTKVKQETDLLYERNASMLMKDVIKNDVKKRKQNQKPNLKKVAEEEGEKKII